MQLHTTLKTGEITINSETESTQFSSTPNYNPPSTNMLRTQVLNNLFSTYLSIKLKIIESLTDITIVLDRWQDVSKNLIYGLMALKENKKHILDIIDLSAN
ncbi:4331_t:CDS:2 [Gigaspora rosea]|nr:4331_t:CDS:2 [Gigaspora rosea]